MLVEFREELATQGQTSKKYTRPTRGSPQRNIGLHTRPCAQALGRRALSNLHITNPNPDLPPALYSSIKIPGHKEKTTVPSLQLLVQSFPQIRSNTLNYATIIIALQRANYASKAGTHPCEGGPPYTGGHPYTGAYAKVLRLRVVPRRQVDLPTAPNIR